MKVLKRGEIVILKSNLKDDTQIFDIHKSYKKGEIVRDYKSKYRAKEDVQTGSWIILLTGSG